MNRQERADIVLKELKRLYPEPKIALTYSSNWELLVAVALSARCTDKKVNEVTKRLFKKYTTIQEYADASQAEMEEYVKQTGFYKAKAKNLIAAANRVMRVYAGVVPKTMEELVTIPGVGRKTANVIMSEAFKDPQGIAVDTHVRRLAKKFKLTRHDNVLHIEKDLMGLYPKHEWQYLTHQFIQYGRDYSPARKVADTDDPISLALFND